MKKDPIAKMIRKLDHPPAGPNFARFVFDDPLKTAKTILAFARGIPPFTYQPAYAGIKDAIELNIGIEQALAVAARKGASAGRESNVSLVRAFFEHDDKRRFPRTNPIMFEKGYFRVSRAISVPVSPLSIVREKGRFVPIFVCGWASIALTDFQRRLLMTIFEDAFLSLTDFQGSPAEVLFFPKVKTGDGPRRQVEVWQRGDYELLSEGQLTDVVENFMLARAHVRSVLEQQAEKWTDGKRGDSEDDAPTPPGTLI